MTKADEILSSKNLGITTLDELRAISPLLKQRLVRNGFGSLQDLIVRGPLDYGFTCNKITMGAKNGR